MEITELMGITLAAIMEITGIMLAVMMEIVGMMSPMEKAIITAGDRIRITSSLWLSPDTAQKAPYLF
jgi:hypothetical protein